MADLDELERRYHAWVKSHDLSAEWGAGRLLTDALAAARAAEGERDKAWLETSVLTLNLSTAERALAALAALRARPDARVRQLEAAIRDIEAHATPVGLLNEDDPEGSPAHYLVTTGSLHRALGVVACGDPLPIIPTPEKEEAGEI